MTDTTIRPTALARRTEPALLLPAGDYVLSARVYRRSDRPALIFTNGEWWDFDGTTYVRVPEDVLRDEAWQYLATARVPVGHDGGTAPFRPTNAKVANFLAALRSECRTDMVNGWRAGNGPSPADEILCCGNGLLHVPTLTLLPPTPDFFAPYPLPVFYDPEAPAPVEFLAFLRSQWTDADGQEIDVLQEWFGYVVSPNNRFQTMFALVGPPRSGKGTLIRVLTALIGAANVGTTSIAALGTRHGAAPIADKSVVVLGDNRIGRGADTAAALELILRVTGGDAVLIDPKHRAAYTAVLPTRFIFAGNEPLTFGDRSGAFDSRLLTCVMPKSFVGREDVDLDSKLLRELSGILNWAIAGLQRLTTRGRFVPPSRSTKALVEINRKSDAIGTFLAERCVVAVGLVTEKDVIYEAWCDWCLGLDQAPGTRAAFGRLLNERLGDRITDTKVTRDDRTRANAYGGIAVRAQQLP